MLGRCLYPGNDLSNAFIALDQSFPTSEDKSQRRHIDKGAECAMCHPYQYGQHQLCKDSEEFDIYYSRCVQVHEERLKEENALQKDGFITFPGSNVVDVPEGHVKITDSTVIKLEQWLQQLDEWKFL